MGGSSDTNTSSDGDGNDKDDERGSPSAEKPSFKEGERVVAYHGPLLYEAKVRSITSLSPFQYDLGVCGCVGGEGGEEEREAEEVWARRETDPAAERATDLDVGVDGGLHGGAVHVGVRGGHLHEARDGPSPDFSAAGKHHHRQQFGFHFDSIDSSGGTLTYEGRFELHMPTENSGTRSRSGGMSVSLASPDGRVVVGGVAGLLVEASPVQIVVGSFLPSYQMEQKNKKPRVDAPPAPAQTPPAVPISSTNTLSSEQGQQMRKKVICTMLLVNLVVSRACISIWNASLDMPRYFDADYYRRRQRVEKKDGMNFIESSVF
ncbi:hypothetical protein ABZP36_033549 [Zizania latifolia]